MSEANRYGAVITRIFESHYAPGLVEFEFERDEIVQVAREIGVDLPRNLGDLIYSFRFRTPLPSSVLATQPEGLQWTIQLAGRGRYRFKLSGATRIVPNPQLASVLIPDATPELIRAYALGDEQALLAIVRYNRLIDTFLGLTTYSLQSHLRTTVSEMGQIEIDELYIGLDKHGCHYVIPVQAKGGRDQIGMVQIEQDLAFALERFPRMRCRPIAAQFMAGETVALFELTMENNDVRIVEERHYRLVPAGELDRDAVRDYRV